MLFATARHTLVSLAVLIVTLFFSTTSAFGQGGVNGSIVGYVFDQTGLPIKGVKITVKSPTQIGGSKVAYSNDEGYFRIPQLLPGVFEVSATAPKLKTVVQKGVNVNVSAPAEVNVIMEVEVAEVEEVKVVEKAPTVSTTSAVVKEVYDAEFIDNLPLDDRLSITSLVSLNTPGAVNSDGGLRVRGGSTSHNKFNVEGFEMNGQPVTIKGLAALEVQTAGMGA